MHPGIESVGANTLNCSACRVTCSCAGCLLACLCLSACLSIYLAPRTFSHSTELKKQAHESGRSIERLCPRFDSGRATRAEPPAPLPDRGLLTPPSALIDHPDADGDDALELRQEPPDFTRTQVCPWSGA